MTPSYQKLHRVSDLWHLGNVNLVFPCLPPKELGQWPRQGQLLLAQARGGSCPRHFFSVWPNSTVGMVVQENTQALVSPARHRYMVGRVRWPGLLLPKPRLSPLASHVTGQDYGALLQRSIFTCLVCVPLRMNKDCQLLGIPFHLSLSLFLVCV